MNHITSPNEPYPSAVDLDSATRTHTQGHWQIRSRKLPISRAAAIDAMTDKIGIPIPEMIFGDNEVALLHEPSGWTIRFDAERALDAVDKTGRDRLQVAHATDWARSRETSAAAGIRDVRPYDWSYSTPYKGTEGVEGHAADAETKTSADVEMGDEAREGPRAGPAAAVADTTPATATVNGTSGTSGTNGAQLLPPPRPLPFHLSPAPPAVQSLPLALLRRRDPILFNDDVILYESELDDNGISVLRVKIRVMPQRLLLLSRYYLRLDHVVVRVRDTRVYVDFRTDTVLREYTAREDTFANAQRSLAMTGLLPDAVIVAMRDANQIAERLPVVEHRMEQLDLSGARR